MNYATLNSLTASSFRDSKKTTLKREGRLRCPWWANYEAIFNASLWNGDRNGRFFKYYDNHVLCFRAFFMISLSEFPLLYLQLVLRLSSSPNGHCATFVAKLWLTSTRQLGNPPCRVGRAGLTLGLHFRPELLKRLSEILRNLAIFMSWINKWGSFGSVHAS